jgi:hypothetical protein
MHERFDVLRKFHDNLQKTGRPGERPENPREKTCYTDAALNQP